MLMLIIRPELMLMLLLGLVMLTALLVLVMRTLPKVATALSVRVIPFPLTLTPLLKLCKSIPPFVSNNEMPVFADKLIPLLNDLI